MLVNSNISLALAIALFAPLAALVLLGLALVPTFLLSALLSWREMRQARRIPMGLSVPRDELENVLWNRDARELYQDEQAERRAG